MGSAGKDFLGIFLFFIKIKKMTFPLSLWKVPKINPRSLHSGH